MQLFLAMMIHEIQDLKFTLAPLYFCMSATSCIQRIASYLVIHPGCPCAYYKITVFPFIRTIREVFLFSGTWLWDFSCLIQTSRGMCQNGAHFPRSLPLGTAAIDLSQSYFSGLPCPPITPSSPFTHSYCIIPPTVSPKKNDVVLQDCILFG